MNISAIRQTPFIILALLIATSALISGCTEEETATSAPPALEKITEANQVAFVRQMVGEYLTLTDKLVEQYQSFKQVEDAHGFIFYRNKTWTPEYMSAKARYQDLLHKQKAYIYRHQLDGLFDRFMNLQKMALHLKHSLQDQDWELERQAMQRLNQEKAEVNGFLKPR